jgi:hypothetical protein
VTTGAAGSSASVTNKGTAGAAVLDFTIPRGATGATGPTGPAGGTLTYLILQRTIAVGGGEVFASTQRLAYEAAKPFRYEAVIWTTTTIAGTLDINFVTTTGTACTCVRASVIPIKGGSPSAGKDINAAQLNGNQTQIATSTTTAAASQYCIRISADAIAQNAGSVYMTLVTGTGQQTIDAGSWHRITQNPAQMA